MHYGAFDITGEMVLAAHAGRHPGRVERLISAVEGFIEMGPIAGSRLYPPGGSDAAIRIYLVPPRAVLRGVPDMGGMVLVDPSAKMIRFLEVIEDYGGDDDDQWRDLTRRAGRWAGRWAAEHGKPDARKSQ